ncbi:MULTISPECIES: amino acid ABC transporter permease [Lonsdalea]|uniref:ABC transporter permease n=3 Tax=Lonsdalea TaxID=1082702 RepID=A0ACD1JCI9_9GAMM|nr:MULTISPECIES: amino acid ABC transporter permease [Lonsdalea]OSM94527.1 ABC transporter permease [Lonsdalea populi]OSN01760.1 ABC transporter permease [Lonsdalea populi]QPQ25357.1 amino acid ABC transporter permease [Lonsdalea populi]RAT13517.1 ABC transporter permease [Lonsdalea quercina]RAT21605.1 ABC transporter permease [Lonsdalea populi]
MIKFDPITLLQGKYLQWIISGLETTLILFFLCLISGFILSLLLASMRLSGIAPLRWFVMAYVEYHRNVPALVQLLLWYFGLSSLLPFALSEWVNQHGSEFFFAYIALTLNTAAFMSEDLRSGLRAIASGQMEACRALGLTFSQSMRDVILPQSIRISIPPLLGQSLALYKSTSLAMAISVAELTHAAKQIENETFRTFEAFAIVSVIYLAGSLLIVSIGTTYDRYILRTGSR